MALLFFDGFDNVSTGMKPQWNLAATWANNTGRDGSANGAIACHNGFYAAPDFKRVALPLDPDGSPVMVPTAGFAWEFRSMAAASTGAILVGFMGAGSMQLLLTLNAEGYPQLRRGADAYNSPILATAANPIAPGKWYHFQVKTDLKTSGGSTIVRLNGVDEIINFSGQNSAVDSACTHVQFRCPTNYETQGTCAWDDFWVTSNYNATTEQGQPNTGFLGDLKVHTVVPNGPGDSTQWTPTTGANWSTVDENPINTTDYVSAANAGMRDLYNVTDLPGATLGVYGVQLSLYAKKADAGSASISPVLRDGVTDVVQSSTGLSTSWGLYYGPQVTKRPSNGAVFTAADINALQIGAETS